MSITLVVILRSIISFFVLLIFVRMMGKQQVSQLNFFDYIVGITIGSIAATLSVQVNENAIATILAMATWTALAIALAHFSLKNVWLRKIVGGGATIAIQNGKILEENLKKIRIPIDALISELRTQGVFDIADVEFALFELGGKLSVQKKSQKSPVTREDLKLSSNYEGLPTNLIMDGVLEESALLSLKLSKAWLIHQLKKKNITDFTKISLAQLDTRGNLYIDIKGNHEYHTISTNEN